MSHEFRTPLSIVLMYLQSLLTLKLSSESRNIVMMTIAQINLLFVLVNDMLDLKLIEVNQFEPKLQVFSPRNTFDFILSMFSG